MALIEQATLPEQRVLRGTLADIAALAAPRRCEPPALLVVGAVAALAAADALSRLRLHSRSAVA